MLISLHIQNIALLEECRLTLQPGLNILSGETGAGKSIIIDALSFALGSRADKSLIRYGSEQAVVEAEFAVHGHVVEVMQELGLEADDTLLIRRLMSETRNDIRVNGQTVTLSMLRKITQALVDIHGQHEHQSLLKTDGHLPLLDKYAGESVATQKQTVASLYARYRQLCKQLGQYGDERERERRKETLAFQIGDIEKVDPRPGEEEELLAQRDKMRNAEKILSGVADAFGTLDGSEGVGALTCLSMALQRLTGVSQYDTRLGDWADRLDSARIEVDDIAQSLRDYAESFDFDSRSAERIESRVDALKRLKRKYGATLAEVLDNLQAYKDEYDVLCNIEDEIAKWQQEADEVRRLLYNACVRLSGLRKQAAKRFEQEITEQLAELAMKGTAFAVQFAPLPDIADMDGNVTADGMDNAEFLISPNRGEPLKPLAKIASGGEMSRFMLALKTILAELDDIDTLVFDEIDTGISGHVAHTVAQKLYTISRTKQVIAITHLPQLASFADWHYLISKSVVADKTRTDLVRLTGDRQVDEVARLAGSQTAAGRAHARDLIAEAEAYKTKQA